jgi:hypothetical protein
LYSIIHWSTTMHAIKRFFSQVAIPLAILVGMVAGNSQAAAVDPNAGHGKKVLYVYNQTKLEKAKAMVPPPPDPKRIPSLEAWRSSDTKAMATLQSLGFVVTGADESSPVEAAKDKDLIVISESVDALDIGNKYRYLAVPIVVFENDLLGELGMTGLKSGRDYGTDENQRFVWIVNAPHPLAAGLPAGTRNVLDNEGFKMNWGKPGLGAVTIATLLGEPDKAAIFAYEKGATMNGEFVAPARRVSFFLWQDLFEHLLPDGMALFKAAVLWAVAPPQ